MRPNVLLIVLDAARRDAVEPYAGSSVSTPAIGSLARRGFALPHAYANASWTLPSHAAMFTGLLPRALGLGQAPEQTPQSARPALERVSSRLLPAVLRDAGYATHAFSTNLWASPHSGFDIGFDSFRYLASGREERLNALLASGPRAALAWARDGLRSRADDGAAACSRALRQSIEAWSGRPTFWFVNLVECHSPYLPPRPWNDLDAPSRIRAALEARRHLSFLSICLAAAGRHEVPSQALGRMRHLYDRAISYMDDWVAGVLEALDRRGILDQTLVVLTSDHGENFGEDGLLAHGFSLDQRLIRVQLVSAGPGAFATESVFSLAELPRAIAGAVGLERHPWSEPALPAGVAISQYDPMGAADDPQIVEFARRWRLDEAAVERLTASFTSATDGRHKLLLRNGIPRCYDLESDPDERRPRDPADAGDGGDRGGPLAPLHAALEHAASAAALASSEPPVDTVAVASAAITPSASAEEVTALERQMKLLGYM